MNPRRQRRLSPAEMQAACIIFNAAHKVGDPITVYTGLYGENPKQAETRTEALILSGHTAGVYVTGEAYGFIALSHVAEDRRASAGKTRGI